MKEYRFHGWEKADVRENHGLDPRDMYDLLSTCWCAETCAPRMRKDWSPENRTLGQCSITAFLIQDLYGGEVYGVPLGDGNYHCFNRVGDCVFDLTSEQFGDVRLDYQHCPEQSRETHFAKAEKKARYDQLKSRLLERIRNPKALLFFDIDGTLFDDDRQMPATVRPAMEEAHRRGHQLIINTGRTLCNMDHRLDNLPIDGWIMGCGTRIIWHGETLRSLEYDLPESLQLRRMIQDMKLPAVYECDTGIYFDPSGPVHPMPIAFRAFAEEHGIARDISETDPEFRAVKMFVFSDNLETVRKLEKESEQMGLPYLAIDRGNSGWEMVPAGYSKGDGIDELRELLGIPRAWCYAFGDSKNDLTMLEHVAHSVAMGNAPEDVKAVCEWVTDRPEADGIMKAMKHYRLI